MDENVIKVYKDGVLVATHKPTDNFTFCLSGPNDYIIAPSDFFSEEMLENDGEEIKP